MASYSEFIKVKDFLMKSECRIIRRNILRQEDISKLLMPMEEFLNLWERMENLTGRSISAIDMIQLERKMMNENTKEELR